MSPTSFSFSVFCCFFSHYQITPGVTNLGLSIWLSTTNPLCYNFLLSKLIGMYSSVSNTVYNICLVSWGWLLLCRVRLPQWGLNEKGWQKEYLRQVMIWQLPMQHTLGMLCFEEQQEFSVSNMLITFWVSGMRLGNRPGRNVLLIEIKLCNNWGTWTLSMNSSFSIKIKMKEIRVKTS